MKPSKILIIHTAFIGDIILATPLIDALAKSFGAAQISFLTIPPSVNLIETHPAIHEVIVFDKRGGDKGLSGLLKIAGRLKDASYDLCICPHRSFRSAYLAYRTGAEKRIGFRNTAWRGAFTDLVRYRSEIHEIERNLSLLQPLGIETALKRPSLFPDDEDMTRVEQVIENIDTGQNKGLFALAPGSVWPTKRWPERYYAQFCRKLAENDWQPVLIGSLSDHPLCEAIARTAGYGLNFAGKFTLRQTGYLLTKCSGLLTNDSAPLHMGMAFDIPVFAIFGPTVPAFGFGPFGPKGFVIERKDVLCRPCTIHGGNKCPVKTFECMELISADEVFRKVELYFANETDGM